MKKINPKILSIPPYISTSWKNINNLYVKDVEQSKVLVISLQNSVEIEIPNLDEHAIEEIFKSHSSYIDEQDNLETKHSKIAKPQSDNNLGISLGLPLQFGGGETLSNMASFLDHNPSLSDSPPMPKEILDKITQIIDTLGINIDNQFIQKPEPHCNCPYCQVARAFAPKTEEKHPPGDEEEYQISDDDLKFREWDITQKETK